ncbi:hypothetical protein AVEN_54527-1 [Araneus ventricosus]|uniref:Uncharacterized protein n=1 Tax=Araneus ventricosus TaxID=182803 RepID=A0A4Y2TPW8_ARAVE|nr:hypothetical protein AVEN_54527-1 [Araneus ventricosus]
MKRQKTQKEEKTEGDKTLGYLGVVNPVTPKEDVPLRGRGFLGFLSLLRILADRFKGLAPWVLKDANTVLGVFRRLFDFESIIQPDGFAAYEEINVSKS